VTEVHVQYLPLDDGSPVVLVGGRERAFAGLDLADPRAADAVLESMLTELYGPTGWTIVAPAA